MVSVTATQLCSFQGSSCRQVSLRDLWAEGGHAVKGYKGKGGRRNIRRVGDSAVCAHSLAERGQERMMEESLRTECVGSECDPDTV